MINREKNTAFYTHEETIIDQTTGEVLSSVCKTITKTSSEPDYIKVYYETMMAYNQIHDVPTAFVLSLSKFLEWTNGGKPQCVTLNKRVKEIIAQDCKVDIRQVERYTKKSVETGLLFKTEYRGVYEVNPFMIAKGKWESIRQLQTQYDFTGGAWIRTIRNSSPGESEEAATETEGSEELSHIA